MGNQEKEEQLYIVWDKCCDTVRGIKGDNALDDYFLSVFDNSCVKESVVYEVAKIWKPIRTTWEEIGYDIVED